MLCTKIVLNVKTKQKQQFVYITCSAGILSLQFSLTMNNLSLYYGLDDAKIRASDKDLPVSNINVVQSGTVKENPKISKYVVFEVSNLKKKLVQPSCLQKVWKVLLSEKIY